MKHTSNAIKKLELLAPAGSLETFRAVIRAGADAVYLGGSQFGARAYANNFGLEELLEALDYAHIHKRKVFLTVNTLLKNEELSGQLYKYLLPYYEAGLDAVIVQDYGVFHFIRKHFPLLPIHTSTQMTVTGVDGARFLKEQGAERIVTARELSLSEIRAIAEQVDVEIESFIHGALCYCYSGQCLLSSMLGGRSGNRGRCAQPCRLPYSVWDEKKRLLNKSNPYILSLKDMNTIAFLPEIAESGVYSFKIEGRMKSTAYAAGVVSVYRSYMDRYLNYGAQGYHITKEDNQKLYDFGNRNGFTEGYYYKHNDTSMLTGDVSTHSKAAAVDTEKHIEPYLTQEIKEKIYGKLTLYKDSVAMIEVTDGENTVYVTGDIVQQAKSRPMERENILQKIQKTGNTPYEFERVEIDMENDIFLPVAALNHLRKEALEQLSQIRLEPYRRQVQTDEKNTAEAEVTAAFDDRKSDDENTQYADKACRIPLVVSTECRAGFHAACRNPAVEDIYLEALLYEKKHLTESLKQDIDVCHAAGKRVFFAFPAVFRQKTREYYKNIAKELLTLPLDGFVVKSYDSFAFAKSYLKETKEIRLDSSIYTYSDAAAEAFYKTTGAKRDTIPVELNRKELLKRNNTDSEFIIYGYLPLMHSAGCVHKNTTGCNKTPQLLFLKDRYGVSFPVRNYCGECFNILYNAKPLFLFHHAKALQKLGVRAYRIHFTFEDEHTAENVLAAYVHAFIEGEAVSPETYLMDYTNGHYKRGVE